MARIAVLMARLEQISGIQVQHLPRACEGGIQLQRFQFEVLLPSDPELICCQGVQLFVCGSTEVDSFLPAQRSGCVLHDGNQWKIVERSGVVAPAQPLRRIRVAAVGTEIDSKARVLPCGGVIQRLYTLNRAQHKSTLRIETV